MITILHLCQFQADVIMALAGSNGGSWSTNFTPNSTVRPPPTEIDLPSTENDTRIAINSGFPREFCGRFSIAGNSSHGIGSSDQMSFPPGQQFTPRICYSCLFNVKYIGL